MFYVFFDMFFLKDILKKEKNYLVLFVGSGPIENILKEKIKEINRRPIGALTVFKTDVIRLLFDILCSLLILEH